MKNGRGNQRDTLIFIIISVGLMIIADQVIFGGKRSYQEKIKEQYYRENPQAVRPDTPAVPTPPVTPEEETQPVQPAPAETEESLVIEPDYRDLPAPEPLFPIHDETAASVPAAESEDAAVVAPGPLPPVATPARGAKGKIAIIIDDVGMNVRNSRAVLALPAPITLAFLPYAPHTPDLAAAALAAGHETMIHVPMEALGDNNGLGPMALRATMDTAAINASLNSMFASFEGYKGINNHMGSKLTQDAGKMDVVMQALKQRGLYFVDSRTIAGSVAADRARAAGLPHAARDVFLDHEETSDFVAGALAQAVHMAQKNGAAIAIGHPKDVTIEGLKAWIPTLKDKGVELVPASALLTRPAVSAAAFTAPSDGVVAAPETPPAPLPATQP